MLGFSRPQFIAFLVMVALIVVCPFVLYPVFLMRVLCAALFACAFNLMLGFVGLLSFGHAAFFGMGSYVTAWTMKFWHIDAFFAIALGGLTGAVLGLCLGYLAIKRSGIYFAMITLALAQLVYFVCLEAPFTGGEDGIQQVPRGHLFGFIDLSNDMTMYWVVAVVFLGGFLMIHRIIHSPFGQVLKGIRENEPRATSLGYRTDDYKLIAFVLSCGLSGLAGGTKALVFGIATLTDVNYPTSGEVVLTTLLGGLGTVFGPVMGALVVTSMEQYLAQAGAWVTVIQGAIFMACVLVLRRGLVGEVAAGGALPLICLRMVLAPLLIIILIVFQVVTVSVPSWSDPVAAISVLAAAGYAILMAYAGIQLSEGQPGAVTLARILLAVGVLFGVPALADAAYGSNGSSALVYATGVVVDVLSIIYLSWKHPAAARVA